MRDGRIGGGAVGSGAALAMTLIAGCASPPPRPPVLKPSACAERSPPANPELLPECVHPKAADPTTTCVPHDVRGRELARDDQTHMRAYELCIPDGRHAASGQPRVDPGRVIVERTGERPANSSDLDTITFVFGNHEPSRKPDLPNGRPAPPEAPQLSARPVAAECWKNTDHDLNCLEIHLQDHQTPQLAPLLAAMARWLPSDGTCIALEVDFDWPEGCPEGPGPMIPQSR